MTCVQIGRSKLLSIVLRIDLKGKSKKINAENKVFRVSAEGFIVGTNFVSNTFLILGYERYLQIYKSMI